MPVQAIGVRVRRALRCFGVVAVVASGLVPAAYGDAYDRPIVAALEFRGNEHFSAAELRSQTLLEFPSLLHPLRRSKFQRNAFPNELRRLRSFYLRHGFGGADVRLDSVITSTDGRAVRLRIGVREGPQTIIRELRYTPPQPVFSLDELRGATPFAPGDPYPYSPVLRGRATRGLRLVFLSRGYLAVGVEDSTLLTPDSTGAVLIYTLHPGPQFTVRAVSIAGNQLTKPDLIRRELTFAPGQIYDYTRLQQSQQNLYNTSLFRSVVIHEEDPDSLRNTVDLAVRVIERQMAFFEGSVGFGKRINFEARATGAWGHRNLFGRGHELEVRSTLAYDLERRGNNYFAEQRVRYTQPHLLGSQIRLAPEAAYTIDRRVEDVEIRRLQLDAQASRKIGLYTSTALGAVAAYTTTNLQQQNISDDLLQTRALSASMTRNSSDNLFEPHRGSVRALALQRAGFGGDNYFTRATSTLFLYQPWGKRVLAMGLRAGWVEPYGPSRAASAAHIGIGGVPFEYLFQAGGSTTVRGFVNNFLGSSVTATRRLVSSGRDTTVSTSLHAGTVLLVGNVELRTPIPRLSSWRLGMVLFLDAGNTWADFASFKKAPFGLRFGDHYPGVEDMRYAYGFGFRYPTPLGPVRLDLGFPLKRWSGVHHFQLHLGLGHPF